MNVQKIIKISLSLLVKENMHGGGVTTFETPVMSTVLGQGGRLCPLFLEQIRAQHWEV